MNLYNNIMIKSIYVFTLRAVQCSNGVAEGVCPQGQQCIADTPCFAINNGLPTPKVRALYVSHLYTSYYNHMAINIRSPMLF